MGPARNSATGNYMKYVRVTQLVHIVIHLELVHSCARVMIQHAIPTNCACGVLLAQDLGVFRVFNNANKHQ